MGLVNIAKGHYNELTNKNQDLSKSRLMICIKCPLYSPKFGGVCDRTKFYNPKTGETSNVKKAGFVSGCGCRLKAKTTLPEASCIIDKW